MQFSQVLSFFTYLESEFLKKNQIAMLLATSDEEERKGFFLKIQEKLTASKELVFQHFDSKTPLVEITMAFSSLTFFSSQPALIIDELDLRKSEEIEAILKLVQEAQGDFTIVLGAKSIQNLSSWIRWISSIKGAILDLRKEKIWEKEKRIREGVILAFQKKGKIISEEALELLLKRMGMDAVLLAQEVAKLVDYTPSGQNRVEVQDIFAITSFSLTYTLWQVAEKVAFSHEFIDEGRMGSDDAFFYGVVRALRSQLEMGLTIALLLEKKATSEEILSHFPKLFPSQLDKRKPIIKERGVEWYSYALQELFQLDLSSKTIKEGDHALLWQLFLGKLFIKKREYARSIT